MGKLGKIMTHLWFDQEAAEAAEFYLKMFENAEMISKTVLEGTPSGTVDSYTLRIEDHTFMLLSAGPYFKINPSVSFMINCVTKQDVRMYYDALMEGGHTLMPLEIGRAHV